MSDPTHFVASPSSTAARSPAARGGRTWYRLLKGPNGLRAGWRLLIYAALVLSLGYGAEKVTEVILPGEPADLGSPWATTVVFGIMLFTMLLVAAMMAKMEGRSFGDYGLPLRRVLCFQFWQGYGVGFLSLAALLAFMRLVGVFSFGPRLLHGAEAWKYGFGWTVSVMLACVLEEYFYRGYLQYTLTGGIGFWPAAVVTSAFMAYMHRYNPVWTWLGLFNVFLFGMVACLLLRRTGDLWLPAGIHAAWDWGEVYFFGVPSSGQTARGTLFRGSFHGPGWLTGAPFGPEAGWPNVALLLIWLLLFAQWFRKVRYPRSAADPHDAG